MRRRLIVLVAFALAAVPVLLNAIGWPIVIDDVGGLMGKLIQLTWSAIRVIWPLLLVLALVTVANRQRRTAAVSVAQMIRRLLAHHRPILIGVLTLGALLLIMACVLLLPQYLVDLDAQGAHLEAEARVKAKNDARATLLQGVGGALLVIGAIATWRQIHITRQGHITDRFTKAIDHLGSQNTDVRLGGIYALERLAKDSEVDRATINDVLSAYVREHSPWPFVDREPESNSDSHADTRPDLQNSGLPDLLIRAADVQAAVTVLSRKSMRQDQASLDLSEVDLRAARLFEAYLPHAVLYGSNLGESITRRRKS